MEQNQKETFVMVQYNVWKLNQIRLKNCFASIRTFPLRYTKWKRNRSGADLV